MSEYVDYRFKPDPRPSRGEGPVRPWKKRASKPPTKELLSPFTFTFWMGAGCVVLLLLALKKKPTPVVQGLSPSPLPPG